MFQISIFCAALSSPYPAFKHRSNFGIRQA